MNRGKLVKRWCMTCYSCLSFLCVLENRCLETERIVNCCYSARCWFVIIIIIKIKEEEMK